MGIRELNISKLDVTRLREQLFALKNDVARDPTRAFPVVISYPIAKIRTLIDKIEVTLWKKKNYK